MLLLPDYKSKGLQLESMHAETQCHSSEFCPQMYTWQFLLLADLPSFLVGFPALLLQPAQKKINME